MKHLFPIATAAALVAACAGEDPRPASIDGVGGPDRPSTRPTGNPEPELDAGLVADEGAPIVTITEPSNLDSPNDGAVLVTSEVSVLCLAVAAFDTTATPVDPSTVEITLLDAQGDALDAVTGVATGNINEYSADFVLTEVPTGRVSFRCTATDMSDPPRTGLATNSNFIDHGPMIEVSSPLLDSAHALEGAIPFTFSVTPVLLADDDEGASVQRVMLTIDGVEIELDEPDAPGEYTESVDLSDDVLFPDTPTGTISVLVTAENSREPDPVTRTLNHTFLVDGTGPAITVSEPTANDVIGGEVTLVFAVVDGEPGSGVDPSTVVVTLGGTEYLFDENGPWTRDENNYTFRFDSVNLEGVEAQLTVNVRAADNAGNVSIGQSLLLYLDNVPPSVDLDPGHTRTFDDANEWCSLSFDPLGEAVNDQAVIGRSALFRTMIWENTNSSEGQQVLYFAGTNRGSARLYIQPDPTLPVLSDTNGDDLCDEIATLDDLDFVRLNPVSKQGSAVFGMDEVDTELAPLGECMLKPPPATTPDPLCTDMGSDLTVVVEHLISTSEPIIYAVGTIAGLECTGTTWEVGALADQDGWICLAARAADNAGNVGVSPPLRVCLDDSLRAGQPACALQSTEPPSCTDGCTPAGRFATPILED